MLSFVMALGAYSSAFAAVITVDFSGSLTSASNLDDTASVTDTGFFQIGQTFNGSFSFDDSLPGV